MVLESCGTFLEVSYFLCIVIVLFFWLLWREEMIFVRDVEGIMSEWIC